MDKLNPVQQNNQLMTIYVQGGGASGFIHYLSPLDDHGKTMNGWFFLNIPDRVQSNLIS